MGSPESISWPPRPPRRVAEKYAMGSLYDGVQSWLRQHLVNEEGKTRISCVSEKDMSDGWVSAELDIDESSPILRLVVFIRYTIDFRKKLRDVCRLDGRIDIEIPIDSGHAIINAQMNTSDRIVLADILALDYIKDQTEDGDDEESTVCVDDDGIEDLPELMDIYLQIREGRLPIFAGEQESDS